MFKDFHIIGATCWKYAKSRYHLMTIKECFLSYSLTKSLISLCFHVGNCLFISITVIDNFNWTILCSYCNNANNISQNIYSVHISTARILLTYFLIRILFTALLNKELLSLNEHFYQNVFCTAFNIGKSYFYTRI